MDIFYEFFWNKVSTVRITGVSRWFENDFLFHLFLPIASRLKKKNLI